MCRRSAFAVAVALIAATLAGCGSKAETVSVETHAKKGPASASVLENGIAGVRIGMSPKRVRGVLGPPNDMQVRGPHTTGSVDLTYRYDHELKVDFLRDDAGRHTAYTISTTSDFFRTVDGIGVGSSRHDAELAAPHCIDVPTGRVCALGGVSFELRGERVYRVSVFSPPF